MNEELRRAIIESSKRIGLSPLDLATIISYETAGTFNPWQKGPRTSQGQHYGLIQWGEPQRREYGVTPNMSVSDQMRAAERYLYDRGFRPGMGLLDAYSAINAGRVGLYNRSDKPGYTVRSHVDEMMGGHRKKAASFLGGDIDFTPEEARNFIARAPDNATARPPAQANEEEQFAAFLQQIGLQLEAAEAAPPQPPPADILSPVPAAQWQDTLVPTVPPVDIPPELLDVPETPEIVPPIDQAHEKAFDAEPTLFGEVMAGPGRGLAWITEQLGFPETAADFRDSAQGVEDFYSRVNRNATAGILKVPGMLPGLIGLGQAGINYVLGTEDTEFADAMFREGGKEFVYQNVEKFAQDYITNNPDATQSEIEAAVAEYTKSDDFYDMMIGQFNPSLAVQSHIDRWANQFAGINQRPDQQQMFDDLVQILSSAGVGIPSSGLKGLSNFFMRGALKKATSNLPARVVGRTIEAVTPLTLPLSGANIVRNTIGGAAVTEFLRWFNNQPSWFNGGNLYEPPPDIPPELMPANEHDFALRAPDGSYKWFEDIADSTLEVTGTTLGVLFGIPMVRHMLKRAKPFVGPDTPAPPRFPEPVLGPGNKVATIFNQLAPITGLSKKMGLTAREAGEVAEELEAATARVVGVNGEIAIRNVVQHGILEGVPNTIPLATLRKARLKLPVAKQVMFDEYIIAKNVEADTAMGIAAAQQHAANAQASLRLALRSNDKKRINQAVNDYNAAQARINDLQTRAATTSMPDWDLPKIQSIIRTAEADPDVLRLAQYYKKLTSDLINYRIAGGELDAAKGLEWIQNRPFYTRLWDDPFGGTTGIARTIQIWKRNLGLDDRLTNTNKDPYTIRAPRDVSGDVPAADQVRHALPPLDSMEEYIRQTVRAVETNRARRIVVDTVMHNGNLGGIGLRRVDFNGKPSSFTDEQLNVPAVARFVDKPEYTTVRRNGRTEVYEFGDKAVTNALKFAPASVVPIFNAMRKWKQTFTTGFGAPWFVFKSAGWDPLIMSVTRQPGRSMGLIDTLGRRVFGDGEFVNKVFDAVVPVDPTAYLQMVAGIPVHTFTRGVYEVALKMEQSLISQSGILGNLAKQFPPAAGVIRHAAHAMSSAFEDTAAVVLMRKGFGRSAWAKGPEIRAEFDQWYASAPNGPFKKILGSYIGVLDAIGDASRMTFFAQNYSRLRAKYGRGGIPSNEIDKLVQATRKGAGDLTRRGGSDAFNRAASTIPYMNTIVQSMRHVFGFMHQHPTLFATRLAGGVMLPVIGSNVLMTNWDDDAADYYYNQLPTWQRMSSIIIPTLETMQYYAENGRLPPFTPESVYVAPLIPPEFVPWVSMMTAGLRSFGLFGPATKNHPYSPSEDLAAGMDSLFGIMSPVPLDLLFSLNGQQFRPGDAITGQPPVRDVPPMTFGGLNADKMTYNSEIERWIFDVVRSVAGTGGEAMMQVLNTFMMNEEDGKGFVDAAVKALEVGKFEVERRIPDIPFIYQAPERAYAQTPETEYVFKTLKTLEPLLAQRSVEEDFSGRRDMAADVGLNDGPPAINDEFLFEIMQVIYDRVSKKEDEWGGDGSFKEAGEKYTNERVLLQYLEDERSSMDQAEYNKQRNQIIKNQQYYREVQARELTKLLAELKAEYGEQFALRYGKELDFDTIVDVMKEVAVPFKETLQ